ncbi:hypothetical protein NQ317_014585, partial [Molorchus minor]
GRRGLLFPDRLPQVVPVVLKALVYDEPRGYSRWVLTLEMLLVTLLVILQLLETHILAPYLNCRRAASAAFQEKRWKTRNFFLMELIYLPQLIFSLVYIAQFVGVYSAIDRAFGYKKSGPLGCWYTLELTAKTLHNLTPKVRCY